MRNLRKHRVNVCPGTPVETLHSIQGESSDQAACYVSHAVVAPVHRRYVPTGRTVAIAATGATQLSAGTGAI